MSRVWNGILVYLGVAGPNDGQRNRTRDWSNPNARWTTIGFLVVAIGGWVQIAIDGGSTGDWILVIATTFFAAYQVGGLLKYGVDGTSRRKPAGDV